MRHTYILFTTILILNLTSKAQSTNSTAKPIGYSDIVIGGELGIRAQKNFDRLETEIYKPENVFPEKLSGSHLDWPGDIEGRVMLGLILEAQATHREPKYLTEMLNLIPKKVNKDGYFGPIIKSHIVEQQLSGNAWFLRALCEYYNWKKDPKIRVRIIQIIQNLALRTKGLHKEYPIDPKFRRKNIGEASGKTELTIGRWELSSDIGCDFIFMDAIIQAYEIVPSSELRSLINEMIKRFFQMDLLGINAQTHATLTSLRGILRYYKINKAPYLLKEVVQRYDLYRSNAMTANFENFNWFGRPDWTEPCAIVDSYMLAVQLWQLTDNEGYLEDAHHIYYNALANTQRENGGFGLNNCTRPEQNTLKISIDEAYWCCTMRGGEGIASAVQYSFFIGANELVIPSFNSCEAKIHLIDKSLTLREISNYPFEGKVSFEVLSLSSNSHIVMKFFAPSWTINHHLTLNGKDIPFTLEKGFLVSQLKLTKGSKVILTFDQRTGATKMVNSKYPKAEYYKINYGPLLLGYDIMDKQSEFTCNKVPEIYRLGARDWTIKESDIRLKTVYHLLDSSVAMKFGYCKQILFKIDK